MIRMICYFIELPTLVNFSKTELSTVIYIDLTPFFMWWQKIRNFVCVLSNMKVKCKML